VTTSASSRFTSRLPSATPSSSSTWCWRAGAAPDHGLLPFVVVVFFALLPLRCPVPPAVGCVSAAGSAWRLVLLPACCTVFPFSLPCTVRGGLTRLSTYVFSLSFFGYVCVREWVCLGRMAASGEYSQGASPRPLRAAGWLHRNFKFFVSSRLTDFLSRRYIRFFVSSGHAAFCPAPLMACMSPLAARMRQSIVMVGVGSGPAVCSYLHYQPGGVYSRC